MKHEVTVKDVAALFENKLIEAMTRLVDRLADHKAKELNEQYVEDLLKRLGSGSNGPRKEPRSPRPSGSAKSPSPAQAKVLRSIKSKDFVAIKDISKKLRMSPFTVRDAIRKLRTKGRKIEARPGRQGGVRVR